MTKVTKRSYTTMTDENKTKIADVTPGPEDRPEGPSQEEVLNQKFQRLQGRYDRLDQEQDDLKKIYWVLEEDLKKETKKYDIFAAKTEEEKKQLKKRPIYTGLIGAIVGAGIAAAILGSADCSCSGSVGSLRSSYRNKESIDAGVVDAGVTYGTSIADAGADASVDALVCPKGESCYPIDKQNPAVCEEGRMCYNPADITDLETQLKVCEEELKKRPQSCPTYTPKACPPIVEQTCEKLPYRKGL